VLENKNKWYVTGLHFDCSQCCNCCSGPGEGYIWTTKYEIKFIADFLKIPEDQFRKTYTKHKGLRTTLIEDRITKDCIFLQQVNGKKTCTIYPVRPNQCRTWPFWSSNLESPNTWNQATNSCPGINRGKYFSLEKIEELRKQKKWWSDEDEQKADKSTI